MKLNKSLVLISSLLTMLLISVFPVLNIFINVKETQNIYLSFGAIIYLLLFILLCLFIIFQFYYYIKFILQSDLKNKFLWILLIIILNIFIFPYFNSVKIHNEKKSIFNLIYIIPLLFYIFIFIYGYKVYTDLNNAKLAEIKRIEEERNTYTTKDNRVSFTFRHGYQQKEVGEYDLYVINEEKPLVFSVFTYNTIDYVQKLPTDYLNKGVEDIKQNKKNFKLVEDLKEIKKDGYTINQVKYEAESEIQTSTKISTSICIYTLSTITFDSNPDYIIYIIEVIPKSVYEDVSKDASEILDTIHLN